MTLKKTFLACLGVLCLLQFGYSQCNTPTISGTFCVGNQLQLNSSITPSSVTWSLGGNVLTTQTATFNTQGTTVAGGNGAGANTNQLNNPDRIFVTGDGTIYIPDLNNDRVQKWLPGATSGITVAGGNGKGSAANQLNRPTAVFVDQNGNLYVADQYNNRVQKWAPGTTQGTTVAGDGNSTALYWPTDVFVDGSGYIYVSDQINSVIKKYPPGGSVTGQVIAGIAGTYNSGRSNLNSPTGIFVDGAGNLYICDTDNYRIQKWGPGATYGVTFASGYNPLDICGDCNGNIYVADYNGNRVLRYDPQGGETLVASGQFSNPIGVAVSANNEVFVADFGNHRIQKFAFGINATFTPATPGTYTLTANYNCCPAYVKTFEMRSGEAAINIMATNTAICPGDPVTFSSQNVNQLTSPVYQWNLNGVNVGTNSDVFYATSLQDNDKVFCNISGVNVCGSNATGISNTIQMKIRDIILPDLGPDRGICPASTMQLKTSQPYSAYVWQDNSTLPELTINAPGKYYVTTNDQCNRTFADTITVSLFEIDNHILPTDTTICFYEKPTITPVKDLTSYYWSDQTTGSTITIAQPGLYWLQAKDGNGCSVRDSINFYSKICPRRGIYVPNAFTPDNNGRNDMLKPVIYGTIIKYRFSIFNRYGQMVFNTTDPAQGWNGTINNNYPNAGTYVWYCTYELEGKKPVTEKGAVLLVK